MLSVVLMGLWACDGFNDAQVARPSVTETGETDNDLPSVEVDCTDGADNDGDQLIDCVDDDCLCLEMDCTDGQDDDQDGLVDCEDSDCLDLCNEICDDNIDNDGDLLVDCSDDECYGELDCGGPYTLTSSVDALYIGWARGMSYGGETSRNYPFAASVSGDVTIYAQPDGDWGGTAFQCSGSMLTWIALFRDKETYTSVGGQYLGYTNRLGGGYIIEMAPNTADSSLQWDESTCPISALLPSTTAFYIGANPVYRYGTDGVFTAQYVPESVYESTFEEQGSGRDEYTVRWLYDIDVVAPPTWRALYP